MKIYILIILTLFSCTEQENKSVFVPENTYTWTDEEYYLLETINKYRDNENLNSLLPDDTHYNLAELRNNHNIELGYISHKQFPIAFKQLIDLGANWAGENLAYGYNTTQGVINAWIKSEGHNKNLLNNWVYIGVKITNYNNRKYYCLIFSR